MIEIQYEKERLQATAYSGEQEVGRCQYTVPGSFWIITHTVVDPAYGGQGIAADLVAAVMEAASAANVKVMPLCSYAAKQFLAHPEYAEREEKSIITVYGMSTCPDCAAVQRQISGNERFRMVEIGEHVKKLKEYIRLRDRSPIFDELKKDGRIGIPCFLLEDGTITLEPEDVGLKEE